MHLLTPAKLIAQTNGKHEIEKEDIKEVTNIFLDSQRSARRLQKNPEQFLI